MPGRYAKFYDLTPLFPDFVDETFVYPNTKEQYHSLIKEYLEEHQGEYLDGDILFIGSTYETRPEYGFATVISNGTDFRTGEYPIMNTSDVYYREAMDSIDEFWQQLEGFGYFDNDRDLLIQELKESRNYEKPGYKEIWKSLLPGTKKLSRKMIRNRVYSNEVLGFPKNVSDLIARNTVFGKSRCNLSEIRGFRKEISYLKKFV